MTLAIPDNKNVYEEQLQAQTCSVNGLCLDVWGIIKEFSSFDAFTNLMRACLRGRVQMGFKPFKDITRYLIRLHTPLPRVCLNNHSLFVRLNQACIESHRSTHFLASNKTQSAHPEPHTLQLLNTLVQKHYTQASPELTYLESLRRRTDVVVLEGTSPEAFAQRLHRLLAIRCIVLPRTFLDATPVTIVCVSPGAHEPHFNAYTLSIDPHLAKGRIGVDNAPVPSPEDVSQQVRTVYLIGSTDEATTQTFLNQSLKALWNLSLSRLFNSEVLYRISGVISIVLYICTMLTALTVTIPHTATFLSFLATAHPLIFISVYITMITLSAGIAVASFVTAQNMHSLRTQMRKSTPPPQLPTLP